MLLLLLLFAGYVAAVPSVPPAISPNTVTLQTEISRAAASASPQTIIVRGEHVFSSSHLLVANAQNLLIDARGATFVFYFGFGMQISGCSNVTVRGLTLDSGALGCVMIGWEDRQLCIALLPQTRPITPKVSSRA